MSASLTITLYLGLGVTLALLRLQQGQPLAEACLAGLLWPLEMLLSGIDAAALLAASAARHASP